MVWLLALVLALLGGPDRPSGPPEDLSASVIAGERLTAEHCGTCHAIGRTGDSPLASAPPLRDIPGRYPVEHLEEALAEGIIVAHDAPMPAFQMEPQEIADILAYMRTLDARTR